jgi:hypothetical protein
VNEPFLHVELEINTVCDLACFGCDRLSDVASKGVPGMTLGQVARFVDESLELDWEWERIRLLGGEPTLHPQFQEMVLELVRYRERFPKVFLQVLTNGIGRAAKYKQLSRDLRFSLHAEQKVKGETPVWFTNTRIVPIDRDPTITELPPCGIFGPRGCGIGLTRHGYFLDGAGASIARVAGYDIGVMHLREVTMEAMLAQAKVLCHRCGHWRPVDSPTTAPKVTETGEVTGKFWQETLEMYNRQRPVLRVYGEA